MHMAFLRHRLKASGGLSGSNPKREAWTEPERWREATTRVSARRRNDREQGDSRTGIEGHSRKAV